MTIRTIVSVLSISAVIAGRTVVTGAQLCGVGEGPWRTLDGLPSPCRAVEPRLAHVARQPCILRLIRIRSASAEIALRADSIRLCQSQTDTSLARVARQAVRAVGHSRVVAIGSVLTRSPSVVQGARWAVVAFRAQCSGGHTAVAACQAVVTRGTKSGGRDRSHRVAGIPGVTRIAVSFFIPTLCVELRAARARGGVVASQGAVLPSGADNCIIRPCRVAVVT